MNDNVTIVDKWAVIVGMNDASGDPRLHLHRIYDFDQKQAALDNIKYLKDVYKIVYVQQIKCDQNLN